MASASRHTQGFARIKVWVRSLARSVGSANLVDSVSKSAGMGKASR